MIKNIIIIAVIVYVLSAGFYVRVGESHVCVNPLVPQLATVSCK